MIALPVKNFNENNVKAPILVAEDIVKIYKAGKTEIQALRGVSLTVFEKEKIFLIGPSGSGKTTLVNILGGILKPTAGRVFWKDLQKDITLASYNEIVKTRRTFISILFQDTKLLPQLSIEENITLAGYYAGLSPEVIKQRRIFLLEFLRILDKRKLKQNLLSSGEIKRAEIAAALISNPKIIIADEPTANLDIESANSILALLDRINKELNIALLVVTHSQNVAKHADRVLELQEGIILGHHSSSISVRTLEKSRLLEIDRQNRLKIPKDLYEKIGKPKHFRVVLRNNELIMKPILIQKKEYVDTQKVITCSVCGHFVATNERFCPYCDSPINVKRVNNGTKKNEKNKQSL